METVRVDICYRPLRIAWAIGAGDMAALRDAARVSFALWGGRFNPIVVVDQQEKAAELIRAFRVDLVLPLGDSEQVKQFPKKFPHLITPLLHHSFATTYSSPTARAEPGVTYSTFTTVWCTCRTDPSGNP